MTNSSMLPQALSWRDPLELASTITDPYFVLLYSGTQTNYSGRYSFLAYNVEKCIQDENFNAFAHLPSQNQLPFENAWFGYMAYGLKDGLETVYPDKAGWLQLPKLCMMRFNSIYQFDHNTHTLTLWSNTPRTTTSEHINIIKPLPKVTHITSNMSRSEYLEKAAHIIQCIHAGDLYQANLTRKFFGEFENIPNPFDLFQKLCASSPAPYSAFIRLDDTYILSSSPESFLTLDNKNKITTRPIKGTAPRGADATSDKKLYEELESSKKDKAENLMIVDLMRNDLAKSCIFSSVKTEKLYEITTHATIHHMSSTITGLKKTDTTALDVIQNAFPPGSMTGAPKIRAINLCSELEIQERGIYSGIIGWMGGDGSCDFSVVIRTLLIRGRKFEFQVGGGIIADSIPERELQETLDKSKGILTALGLSSADIANL